MKQFLEKWRELNISCIEADDLMDLSKDSFLVVAGSYKNSIGNENNEDFMQLHNLLPDADVASQYWEENNNGHS